MRPIIIGLMLLATILVCQPPANAQTGAVLKVAVTIPDFIPIVEILGRGSVEIIPVLPVGTRPSDYGLTEDNIREIGASDLIVLANSSYYPFEGEIAAAFQNIKIIDWNDYQRHGAALKSFPNYENNVNGYWLNNENAKAIAAGIAETLMLSGLDIEKVTERLTLFTEEIEAVNRAGIDLIAVQERQRSTWIVMIPDIAYAVDNLGLGVGEIVMRPSGDLPSGQDLDAIIDRLLGYEFAGLVTPICMKGSEVDRMAVQLTTMYELPLCYVSCLDGSQGRAYMEQASYNAGAISSSAARGGTINPYGGGGSSMSTHLAWGFIVFVLVVTIVMLNLRNWRNPIIASPPKPPDKKRKK